MSAYRIATRSELIAGFVSYKKRVAALVSGIEDVRVQGVHG